MPKNFFEQTLEKCRVKKGDIQQFGKLSQQEIKKKKN